MKSLITAAALALAAWGGVAVAPAAADAQSRFWHGPAHGPRWHAWRRGYYARWRREPVRFCRHSRCWYR